jgi:hypothetical protein
VSDTRRPGGVETPVPVFRPEDVRELAGSELAGSELADWDDHTVDVPGGDLYQSRTWAEYRARHGWRPRFLVFPDGFRVLALERPWPLVGGSGAYVSRGPVRAGEPAAITAGRAMAAARWLAAHGVDVVSSDAEIPADTGYADMLRAAGFVAIDEIQPSRHRMAIELGSGASEDDLLMAVDMTTRQRIRKAIRGGLRVVRYDTTIQGEVGEGFEAPTDPTTAAPGDRSDPIGDRGPGSVPRPVAEAAFGRLYDLLVGTAARRDFRLGAREPFLDWAVSGLEGGRIVLLETVGPDGETLGAAMFYRHGRRLTYSHSADKADARRAHPGVAHLQLWRAIQLAVREGLAEVDLGGVDVPGARRVPLEGEPMYGLYAFKRSFGARWIEQAGAHQLVARSWRYGLGRVAGRLVRGTGRR